jgi:hypothetical protein
MSRVRLFSLGAAALVALLATFYLSAPASPAAAQQAFTATPAPFVGTYVLPSPTPSACTTPLGFKAGDIVVLIPGIALRAAPDPNSALLQQFDDRREFLVLDGPVCTGGFNWWPLKGHGFIGWAAEGRTDGREVRYWLSLVRAADEAAQLCLTPQPLVNGSGFLVNYNVRVRAEPTTTALTYTVVAAGGRVTILEGPTCNEGYNWWKVRAVVLGITYDGWMAESDRFGDDVYIALPPRPDGSICDFPLNLRVGDRARVIYRDGVPKRLRGGPSLTAPILYDLVEGVPLEIIGGPICNNTYNWWQVRVLASAPVEGWFAEGGPAQYWLARNVGVPTAVPTITATP